MVSRSERSEATTLRSPPRGDRCEKLNVDKNCYRQTERRKERLIAAMQPGSPFIHFPDLLSFLNFFIQKT
jgi:hypothetical protein